MPRWNRSPVRGAAALGAAGLVVLTLSAAAATHRAAAPTPGLPAVPSGHRPGPDVLYAPPARAPQLENTGVWRAAPILVSGAQEYAAGEWLYQDYLLDDHGAVGAKQNSDPYGPSAHLYSPAGGTFVYPTGPAYANNAADLVELRLKPLGEATAFRVTLNTLKDPAKVAFTLALGDGVTKAAWPDAAGVTSPASVFVTWHGDRADAVDAASGKVLSPAPSVKVDLVRRQVQVLVPHADWNPGRGGQRVAVGVGLWDSAAGSYLRPAVGDATATTPGGGTPSGVAIVNVGPRFAEPLPTFAGTNMGDSAALGEAQAPWWRDRMQSEQLALGDVAPFSATVDFGRLATGAVDTSGVPTTGPIDRILASHYSYGQGVDPTKVCYDLAAQFAAGAKCVGREVGQLQTYALYVPRKPRPHDGYGLTLLLHALSANYNQYTNSRMQAELGERGPGSLVVTPSGRGPDGFYAGVAEADTFETWADVARHYALDPGWAAVSGYSMGGFGTYRLLARWPDLFARGFAVVGAPGSVSGQLPSLRNTPLLLWNAVADELVNLQTSENAVAADTAAGLRFEEDLYATADHLTLAGNDEYGPGAAFLGVARVTPDPVAVSFAVNTPEDTPSVSTVSDHAYWLSGLAARGTGIGSVDAVSAGFSRGLPTVLPVAPGTGALTGGEIPALGFVSRTQSWTEPPRELRRDALTLTARNLGRVVIDVRRARVSCAVRLAVTTDGPLAVTLAGCGRTLHFR